MLALLATLTLVWGTNWPLFAIALRELPVATFRTFVLITAILDAADIVMRLRGESFAVPRGKLAALIVASMMNITIWNIATSLAVLYIPSGHASVLAYTMPLWVALIGFVVFRQPLTGRLLLAILIGAAAVVALMVPNFQSYAHAPPGLFWGLFAGFCWAIGTFVVKRTSWPGMGLSLTFWQVVDLPAADRARLAACSTAGRRHCRRPQALVATVYTGAVPDGAGHRRPGSPW